MKGIFLAFMVLAMTIGGASAQRLTLVRNGRTEYVILVAPDAPAPLLHGAQEVQRFVREMSGAELPIVTGHAPPDTAKGRCIRIQQETRSQGTRDDPVLGEEEFHLRTLPPALVISGGGKRGALYGCYAFLEDVLGCRWYTARISKIPKRNTITIGSLDRREKPAFEYREPYYQESFDRDWAVRNRTNGNAARLDESVGGKISYGPFVHTFSSLVPPDVYFDQHPEYFSMINGKRMKGYYQLCLTNPDVLKITIEKVKEWIRENPNATIFSVSQNDTAYNCQCDNCKAVEKEEGAPSGVLLRFVNAVADAVGKEYPHVLIDTLAYQWSEDPPLHARPHPNVRIRLAPIGACVGHGMDQCPANQHVFANLSAWSKITDQLYIWHYSTNFANYLQPLPDLNEIATDIPLFKRHGVVGLFYEGDYAPGGGGEMSELKAYLMAKLMWNPDRPARPIIEDFVDGVYGKGAPYILKWLDLLQANVRDPKVVVRIYDPPTAPYLPDSTLTEGDALFTAAEKATAGDPVALDEVQRARLALEYVELMRARPQYTVVGDRYAPGLQGARADLAQRVAGKIQKYSIGQVREGEPAANFLSRIDRQETAYKVLTLENDSLRLDVVPELGGRIVRLVDKHSGRNLLREPAASDPGYPAAGGYEEYSGGEYRSPGWSEAYEGVKETAEVSPGAQTTRLRVSARMPGGVVLVRTYWLDGDTLHLQTVATNTSALDRTVALRAHPEFAVPPGAVPHVSFQDRTGKAITLTPGTAEQDTFLRGDAVPNGAWTLHLGDVDIAATFDPTQVDTALFNGTLTGRRANLELFGVSRTLTPQATATLEQTWRIIGTKP